MMAVASRGYVRHAVDPAIDMRSAGDRVYFATSGEAVTVLDFETQTFRPTRLVDLYDAARLVDRLPNIHWYGQPFIATEQSEEVLRARHQRRVRGARRHEQAVRSELVDRDHLPT